MKYIIFFFILCVSVVSLVSPASAKAWEDPWAFLYEFPLIWQDTHVVQAESYRMTTGDAPAMTPGVWTLSILSESGEQLQGYVFNPEAMATDGKFSLIVPADYRGAQADILDPSGKRALMIDLRESRMCDDNGVCDAFAGEILENCPTDCGRATVGTASITGQISIGERVGGLLLRVSSAMAGVLLLMGIVRMLDNRRRT